VRGHGAHVMCVVGLCPKTKTWTSLFFRDLEQASVQSYFVAALLPLCCVDTLRHCCIEGTTVQRTCIIQASSNVPLLMCTYTHANVRMFHNPCIVYAAAAGLHFHGIFFLNLGLASGFLPSCERLPRKRTCSSINTFK
jgi:hypothetical protein